MDADALMHPRGPLPPVVYWRRRVITLAAALLVLVAVLKACSGDGDKSSLTATPSTTPSASAKPSTPVKSGAPSTSTPPVTSVSPSPSATPGRAEGQPCRDTDLEVTATADAKEYAAGVRPRLTLRVTNRAPVSCTRDLGGAARELRVMSGNDRVWSSDDCSPGGAADVVTLPAGGSRSFPVTWSRSRSRPGCPGGREPAAPGTYRVVGRLGSIERPGDVFALRA